MLLCQDWQLAREAKHTCSSRQSMTLAPKGSAIQRPPAKCPSQTSRKGALARTRQLGPSDCQPCGMALAEPAAAAIKAAAIITLGAFRRMMDSPGFRCRLQRRSWRGSSGWAREKVAGTAACCGPGPAGSVRGDLDGCLRIIAEQCGGPLTQRKLSRSMMSQGKPVHNSAVAA